MSQFFHNFPQFSRNFSAIFRNWFRPPPPRPQSPPPLPAVAFRGHGESESDVALTRPPSRWTAHAPLPSSAQVASSDGHASDYGAQTLGVGQAWSVHLGCAQGPHTRLFWDSSRAPPRPPRDSIVRADEGGQSGPASPPPHTRCACTGALAAGEGVQRGALEANHRWSCTVPTCCPAAFGR